MPGGESGVAMRPRAVAPVPAAPDAAPRAARPRRPVRVRRVLMTADAVGGVWPYSLDLSSALRARGVEVTVATMGPPPGDVQRAAAAACGVTLVEGSFRLEWMEDPWEDVRRAGDWLLDLERRVQADAVHLNGFCHAALPWQAPVLVAGHSCVRSWWRAVHGSDPPVRWDRYSTEVARGLAAARVVVAPSAAMLSALRREYGQMMCARVIPNGRAGAERSSGSLSSKQPVVFAAGRVWDEAKNIEALCAVAPALPWRVHVAGDAGSPDGRAAPPAVQHLGRLDGADLQTWFARAAIYALPVRYEPFGLSVLEAAMAGCALVLGDVSSLRENWSGAAVFVPPDNRRALAAAIRGLIEDADERTRLAERAQARARHFSADQMATGYLQAYQDMVNGHERGACSSRAARSSSSFVPAREPGTGHARATVEEIS